MSNSNYCCKQCDAVFDKFQALASHVKYVHGKTQVQYTAIARDGVLKRLDLLYGEYKEFTVSCATCGTEFTVCEREKQHPKKSKYYCNRSCANTRHQTENSKSKISSSVKTAWQNGKFDNVDFTTPRRSSVAEREIRQILKDRYGASDVLAHRIKQYYDIRRAVDLSIPKFNAVIEYDGIFHFQEIYEGSFERVHYKDVLQNKYCAENGIKLIRIKYTVYEADKLGSINRIIDILENNQPGVYLLYDK